MTSPGLDQLHNAIQASAEVALSLPAGRDLHHYRSRILRGCDAGFWVSGVAHARDHVDRLIESRKAIGLSFQDARGDKLLTISRILRCDGAQEDSSLLMEYPRSFEYAQRRNDYRVSAPAGISLTVRVWAVPSTEGPEWRSCDGEELPAEIWNVGAGGIGLVLGAADHATSPVSLGQVFRILLTFGREHVLLAARLRHMVRQPDGSDRAGLQFQFTEENGIARLDRARLLRIITHLRRVECRQHLPVAMQLSV